ncbi:MAG: hypothetical protein KAW46_08980 [candidate division Zixibacteria bacterium]|nr:hypothetical protein [candidate division Zixibacteria bacterium]
MIARQLPGSFALILIILLLAVNAASFDLNGYYKSFATVYDLPSHTLSRIGIDPPPLGQVTNRLRLDARVHFGSVGSFSVAYDIVPRIQDRLLWESNLLTTGVARVSYRAIDFDRRIYPSSDDEVSSFGLLHNLDRAVVSVNAEHFDLYVGRQAIAWGSARAVNPTDVIAPYANTELDTEDRIGVDAVRVRVPMGFMGEIDAGYLFGDDFEFDRSAIYLRAKTYLWRTDVSTMILGFQENLLLGVDLARAVGGAGVWLEAGYVLDDAMSDRRRCSCGDYWRASIGVDYSLGGTVYGFLEYHFNGAGSNDADDYIDILSSSAFTEGGVSLMGQHYLIPGASWQITPLVTGSGELLFNLGDPSVLLAPTVEYNVAENIYLAAGAFVGIGRTPSLTLGGSSLLDNLRLRSEFGTYPNIYYSSFRVYF